MLRQLPLFASFPDEEIAALATRSRRRLFGGGERIFGQDEPGEAMYVVLEGTVSVRLAEAEAAESEIYTVVPGQVFGHMSALTGANRLATVRAAMHVVLAELDKATLAPSIEAHPDVIDIVAREILRIDTAHEGLRQARDAAKADMSGMEHGGLIDRLSDRIRTFFGERPPRG